MANLFSVIVVAIHKEATVVTTAIVLRIIFLDIRCNLV